MKHFRLILVPLLSLILIPFAQAQEEFSSDLFINAVEVEDYVLIGDQVRFYIEIGNSSANDLKGVVQVYDEVKTSFIGPEQSVSVLSNQTDAVFFDYVLADKANTRDFNIRVIPNDPNGDNPNNNTRKVEIYVDVDTDGDGQANRADDDDDNDGVNDDEDAFRLDPEENKDSDEDGIGDNADTDDDNDGVEDIQDAFPLDPEETKDSDEDGVGDNADVFPKNPDETQDTDGDGLGNNADTHDENKGPILQMSTAESVVPTHTTVTFSAKGSADPDGKVVKYEWDFGDGEVAQGEVVEHNFRRSEEYEVTLKITDDAGESRTESLTLTVVHKWQVYVLAGLALLLLLLLILYWIFSKKRKKDKALEAAEEKVSDLTLKELGKPKKSTSKKKSESKKSAPKKSTKKKKS